MNKNDGGPAFPFPTHNEEGACGQDAHPGMTLRDWFAGQAMAGHVLHHATDGRNDRRTKESKMSDFAIHAAYDAYVIADALLAARMNESQRR